MRKALTISAMIAALYVSQVGATHAEVCNADKYGGLVCGDGDKALRVIDKTTSPSRKFAFAWRSAHGVASGDQIPPDGVENILIRLADGAVLARLGGTYWANGEMRANRDDVIAAWSSDSRAVIEVSNDRWDTYSLAYYAVDRGDQAAALDLRALVEPALKAKLPPSKRESYSFRVREDLPVKLDFWWSGSVHGDALRAQGGNQPRLQRAGRHRVRARQADGADRIDAADTRLAGRDADIGAVAPDLEDSRYRASSLARSPAPRPSPSLK